jgi:hypothetical protein
VKLNAVHATLKTARLCNNSTNQESSALAETSKLKKMSATRLKVRLKKHPEADPRRLPHALSTTLVDQEVSQKVASISVFWLDVNEDKNEESLFIFV